MSLTFAQLIEALREKDVQVSLSAGAIKYDAPRGAVTPEIRSELRRHKTELLSYLRLKSSFGNDELPSQIIKGDSEALLTAIPDNSIDCLATDPPYGYGFMCKDWDCTVPKTDVWNECLRVLKPGAFAFVMSAPRQDVLGRQIFCIEEAGFDVSFSPIYWVYNNGFPKIASISRSLDRKASAKRRGVKQDRLEGAYASFQPKPAVEVIIVAMKPLKEKTFLDQAQSNKKGITWLDDCRIPTGGNGGRLPANLLVSEECLGGPSEYFDLDAWAELKLPFILLPKASKREKEAGLGDREDTIVKEDYRIRKNNVPFKIRPEARKNPHPTVKPVKLMAYLISLGSRESDIILDPFCGSGTTCIAAKLLKRKYLGIELNTEYHEIAVKRVNAA
jgi:DNA modification methylase